MTSTSKDSKIAPPRVMPAEPALGDRVVTGPVPDLYPDDTHDDPEVLFRERGINKSVWSTRPYLRYTPGHYDHVVKLHELYGQRGICPG